MHTVRFFLTAHMTNHGYGHGEPNVHIDKAAAFGCSCMFGLAHAAQEILLAPAWVVEASLAVLNTQESTSVVWVGPITMERFWQWGQLKAQNHGFSDVISEVLLKHVVEASCQVLSDAWTQKSAAGVIVLQALEWQVALAW